MAIGTGSHWSSPLLGADNAGGGLYEEVPVEILSRINRASVFWDNIDATDMLIGTSWTRTQLAANGAVSNSTSAVGGVLLLDPGAVDNDGLGSVQLNIAAFQPSNSASPDGLPKRIISCAARFSMSDFSSSDFFFGLAGVDPTLMSATGALLATGADNIVGFHHAGEVLNQGGINQNDANDIRLVSAGAAVANMEATLLSLAQFPVPVPSNAAIDTVMVEYGIKIIGTQSVEFYRNGRLVHRRRMANALSPAMTISFANINVGGAAGQNIMSLDYCWACTSR